MSLTCAAAEVGLHHWGPWEECRGHRRWGKINRKEKGCSKSGNPRAQESHLAAISTLCPPQLVMLPSESTPAPCKMPGCPPFSPPQGHCHADVHHLYIHVGFIWAWMLGRCVFWGTLGCGRCPLGRRGPVQCGVLLGSTWLGDGVLCAVVGATRKGEQVLGNRKEVLGGHLCGCSG
jgi:hypothetical protein